MNHEPWIGDATADDAGTCSFNSGALGEGPRCSEQPTLHVKTESAMHGVVALPTCDRHAPIARAAGLLLDEHPYGPGCRGQTSFWTANGICLPVAP